MIEETLAFENQFEGSTMSMIFCVNTNCAYVYEILNGDIIQEKKVYLKE